MAALIVLSPLVSHAQSGRALGVGGLRGCTVWRDSNADCTRQPAEIAANTTADGFFTLEVNQSSRLSVQPAPHCVSALTGQPLAIRLTLPAAAPNLSLAGPLILSPLVALSSALIDTSLTPIGASQAAATVQAQLGLSETVDIYRYDPFLGDDIHSAGVLLATLQVGALVHQLDALQQAVEATADPLVPPSPPLSAGADSSSCLSQGGASLRR